MKAANLYGVECENNRGVARCLGKWQCGGRDEPTCVSADARGEVCEDSELKKYIVCDGDYRAEIVPNDDYGCHLQCDFHKNNWLLIILVCGGILLLFLLIFFIRRRTKPSPAQS